MHENSLSESLKSGKTLTAAIYGLYAASLFVGITALIAIVINHVKVGDMAGTFLESHFRWQIRTFWFGLLWTVLGMMTRVIGIGWIVLTLTAIWVIYRIVKGFLRLGDNKPMYDHGILG